MANDKLDQGTVPVPLIGPGYPVQGLGKPSKDQPVMKNPQAVKVPGDVTPRRKK